MEVEDAFWFEEVEEVLFDENAEGGEDAESGGVFVFEGFDGDEVVFGAGVEDEVDGRFENF